MLNITITADQSVYSDARVFAARHKTSASAIVKSCLQILNNLRFVTEALFVMARNRRAAKTSAHDREQARRAALMATLQAAAKSAQSSKN
jgi:hypothetical protein